MSGLQFASSLVGSLAWPLVLVVALVLFRRPLGRLIGRLSSYEGMGQKLTFGKELAEAEKSVETAAQLSEALAGSARATGERSIVAREAESNPSFTVIVAWEQLSSVLADLVGTAFPDITVHGSPLRFLYELQTRYEVPSAFVKAVQELRGLRNRVAHGTHNRHRARPLRTLSRHELLV